MATQDTVTQLVSMIRRVRRADPGRRRGRPSTAHDYDDGGQAGVRLG